MKFDKVIPAEILKPYIRYYVVSENTQQAEYTVFPSSGLVIGFQYRGQLSVVTSHAEKQLAGAGITGIVDSCRIFRNSADIGTILIYFTEIGFAHFTSHPANELFNQSISLDHIFDRDKVIETEERLSAAGTSNRRIQIVERFLLSQLKDLHADKLISVAVKIIYQTKGNIRIKELSDGLCISQSPLEKRFRKVVGTTPKKFASIVRFNTVMQSLNDAKSLNEICYENNFFDQAHFIKDFKKYTGNTPEKFKHFL